jgi:hypothetical protein
MTIKLSLLKKYGLRVSAVISALALPLLVALPVANAAVASPLNSCESGFSAVHDGNNLYLNAGSLGDAVTVGTNNTSCWKGPPSNGTYAEFKDEGGNCLAWNEDALEVVTQTCNGANYQEWAYGTWSNGSATYTSEWAVDDGSVQNILGAQGPSSGDHCILIQDYIQEAETEWYA